MMQKYFTSWNIQQWIYTFFGLLLVLQAFLEKEWLSLPFGFALILMAILKLGCVSGNCSYIPPQEKADK
jgi:hypothetical protein